MTRRLTPAEQREADAALADYLQAGREKAKAQAELAKVEATVRKWYATFAALGVLDQPDDPVVDTPYLTTAEAAAYLRVSVQTFYNWCSIYGPPDRTRAGYTRENLDRWLGSRRRRR